MSDLEMSGREMSDLEPSDLKKSYLKNPFPKADADRHALWDMLVRRDIEAFLACDWSLIAEDFIAEPFHGIHGHFLANPDSWRLCFPDLESYRQEWLKQAQTAAETAYAEDLRTALFRATVLRDIEISGSRALLHKKFDGVVARSDGGRERLQWQTLYFCAYREERWKISGFIGYLPHPMGQALP